MFVNPFHASGNQVAVLIVAEQDDPIENTVGPFPMRQNAFRSCAERPKKIGNVAMAPGNQDASPWWQTAQGGCELDGLIGLKMKIDLQVRRLRKGLDGQA